MAVRKEGRKSKQGERVITRVEGETENCVMFGNIPSCKETDVREEETKDGQTRRECIKYK